MKDLDRTCKRREPGEGGLRMSLVLDTLGFQYPWGSQEEPSHRQLGILVFGTQRSASCRYRFEGHQPRGVA